MRKAFSNTKASFNFFYRRATKSKRLVLHKKKPYGIRGKRAKQTYADAEGCIVGLIKTSYVANRAIKFLLYLNRPFM